MNSACKDTQQQRKHYYLLAKMVLHFCFYGKIYVHVRKLLTVEALFSFMLYY